MLDLIDRAREYVKDRYLDVADVPMMIKAYVELYDRNKVLMEKVNELENHIGYLEDRVDKLEDELDNAYDSKHYT
jgi:cell division septum initiation protein DivIVA